MRTLNADLTTAQQAATGIPFMNVRVANRTRTDTAKFLSPGLELLPNRDWEIDGSLDPVNLGGWIKGGGGGGTTSAGTVTNPVRSGVRALYLNATPGASDVNRSFALSAELVTILIGSTIEWNIYARGSPGFDSGVMRITVTGGTGSGTTVIPASDIFTLTTLTATIGAGATAISFQLETSGAGARHVYVDDMDTNLVGVAGRVVGIRAAEGLYGGALYNISGPDGRTIPVALEVKVSNSDQALSAKDYRGYKCNIDWGFSTLSGIRYSTSEPYWIVAQRNESREGELYTIFTGMSAWQLLEYRKTIGESTGTAYTKTQVPRHSLLDVIMTLADTVLLYDDSVPTWADMSTAAQNTTLDDIKFAGATDGMLMLTPAVGDAIYVGDDVVFDAVSIWISTAGARGAETITLVKEYYNGTAWVALTTEYDGIGDFTTAGLKTLKFAKPTDWAKVVVSGILRYYMRWRVSAVSGGAWTTAPLAARISIQDGWGFEISLSDGIENTYSQTITTTYDTSINSVLQTILDRTQSALVMTEFYFKLFDYDLTPSTDYTYQLSGGHTYYDSRFEQGLVIPNRVVATDLAPITGTFNWSGTSGTTNGNVSASQALVGIILEFIIDGGITSDAIAVNVANRQLNRYVEQAFSGYLVAPMNCGQEPWDYIQVTDTRASKTWNGRVGGIVREWQADAGLYRIILDLGLRKATAVDYSLINRIAELSALLPATPTDILFKEQQDKAKADEQKVRNEAQPIPVTLPPPLIVQSPPPIALPTLPIALPVAVPTPTAIPLPPPPLLSQHSINIIASQALPGETLDETTARLQQGIRAEAETAGMTTDEIIARNEAILNAPKPKEPLWRRIF